MTFKTVESMSIDAIDAFDLATLSREYGKWLSVLMRSIQLDAKHNEGANAESLSGLGQYLADELTGQMESEAERIKQAGGFS